jgi:hypothetical protein
MRRFKTFASINEASLMKPDYVIGHKVVWKGTDFAELGKLGYTKGDVFEIVSGGKVEVSVGKETGEIEKFIKGPDGKVIRLKGGQGYKSSAFTHYKEGGGIPSGAEWEDLIVFAYNKLNGVSTDPATEEVAMKYWDKYSEQSFTIAKNFKKGLSAKQLVQTGRGIGSVSLGPIWKESGARNKTPKTDIASSDFNEKISLKKAGGSQLASAEKKEAIAIVKAALAEMGNEKKFAQDLVSTMEENMTTLISKESVTALSKSSKAGEKNDAVIDFEKKDKGNKELSAMLESYINSNTEANTMFSKYVVLEASTGNQKFGSPNSKAAANLLGKFDPTGKVVLEPINTIHDPIIVKYSQSVKPYVAFKKGGGASPAYSAFRLSIKEEVQTFHGLVMEELSQVDGLLTEDFLAEGPLDMLKRAASKAKSIGKVLIDKVNNAIKAVIKKVSGILKKIASLGKKMFSSLMKFLGLDIAFASNIPGEVTL